MTTQWITYSSSTYYLPVKSADGNGHETHTAYDSLWKMYPLVVTNVLSLADPSQNLTTTSEYSYTLGQATAVTASNGAVTAYEYDAFGRLTKAIRPGDSSAYPTLQYEYCDTCSPLRIVAQALITSGQSTTLPTIRFYNGLGQLIEENLGTSDGSQMSVAHSTYNAGLLQSQGGLRKISAKASCGRAAKRRRACATFLTPCGSSNPNTRLLMAAITCAA